MLWEIYSAVGQKPVSIVVGCSGKGPLVSDLRCFVFVSHENCKNVALFVRLEKYVEEQLQSCVHNFKFLTRNRRILHPRNPLVEMEIKLKRALLEG